MINSRSISGVICLLALLGASCSNGVSFNRLHSKNGHSLVIDFQAYFKDSPVVLYVDGNKEFEGILTSIDVLSYTGKSILVHTLNKEVDLRVVMGLVEFDQKVNVEQGNHVGILFNSVTKKFSIIQSPHEFLYE